MSKKQMTVPPFLSIQFSPEAPLLPLLDIFLGSEVLTWCPETLWITLSVSNIQHLSPYTHCFPPPSVSSHFLMSSFLCFFFVTYHQTYWILHDRPFWWGGRQKRHALKAGAGSHFSQGVVGNLQSFPGFWPTPLSQPCPPSTHLYFVKTLQKVPWGQETLSFYVLKRQKFLVSTFLSPTESFSVTWMHPSLLHLTVVSIDRPKHQHRGTPGWMLGVCFFKVLTTSLF